jgi:hypothetical protein
MQKTLFTAFAAMFLTFGASTVSAQHCHPDTPHVHTTCEGRVGEARTCDLIENCVCDDGFHADGNLANGDPNCVANASASRTGSSPHGGAPPVCDPELLGTELSPRGICRCTEEAYSRGGIGTSYVFISVADRRAHGLPIQGEARGCYVYGANHSLEWLGTWRQSVDESIAGLRSALLAMCDQPLPEGVDAASLTWVQIQEMCRTTRAMIGGTSPGDTNIGPRLTEIDNRIIGIRDDIDELRQTVEHHTAELADHESRITALEHILRAIHIRVGAFGLFGGELNSLTTGAGGVSGELLVRMGDLPIGFYGRIYFGGQYSAWGVGGSFYVGGGGGVTAFFGDRNATTLSLGYHGDTLLDPYVQGDRFPHDSLGTMNGAQLLVSIPLPGDAHIVRIEASLIAGLAERRLIDQAGVFRTPQDAFLAGTLGIVIQPD